VGLLLEQCVTLSAVNGGFKKEVTSWYLGMNEVGNGTKVMVKKVHEFLVLASGVQRVYPPVSLTAAGLGEPNNRASKAGTSEAKLIVKRDAASTIRKAEYIASTSEKVVNLVITTPESTLKDVLELLHLSYDNLIKVLYISTYGLGMYKSDWGINSLALEEYHLRRCSIGFLSF
jgi:hypothetical protein